MSRSCCPSSTRCCPRTEVNSIAFAPTTMSSKSKRKGYECDLRHGYLLVGVVDYQSCFEVLQLIEDCWRRGDLGVRRFQFVRSFSLLDQCDCPRKCLDKPDS